MKRKTELLLVCAMSMILFACMSVSVFADTDDDVQGSYSLWIGNTQVTDVNKDSIPHNGGGEVSFDPATNTLTLNNVQLSEFAKHGEPGYQSKNDCIFAKGIDLTIHLIGDNKISGEGETDAFGIEVLNITEVTEEQIFNGTAVFDCGLTIEGEKGSTLTVYDVNHGIYSYGPLDLKSGDIKVFAKKSGYYIPAGLSAIKGDLTIGRDTLEIQTTGNGILCRDIRFTGGKTNVSSYYDGIDAKGNAFVSGGDLQIRCTSEMGVDALRSITIDGGTVDVQSYEQAMHASYGDITISAGIVKALSETKSTIFGERSISITGAPKYVEATSNDTFAIRAGKDLTIDDNTIIDPAGAVIQEYEEYKCVGTVEGETFRPAEKVVIEHTIGIEQVDITIDAPSCKDVVKLDEGNVPAGAQPKVTVPEDANYSAALIDGTEKPSSYWGNLSDGEDQIFEKITDGVVEAGRDYYAQIDLQPKDCYYFTNGKDTMVKVTVNGETIKTSDTIVQDKGQLTVVSNAIKATHPLEHTAAVVPTLNNQEGNYEYWYCPKCGKYFKDKNASEEYGENEWIYTVSQDVIDAAATAQTLIGEAEKINAGTYSAKSYAAVKTALEALKKVLADDPSAVKPINDAKQALQTAIKGLRMDQTLNVKAAKKTVKLKKVRKKAQKVKPLTVKGQKTTVTYKGTPVGKKAKKALKINKKTGKITVKKKTRKGTYKMKVTVTAAGNAKYESATKKATVIIRVK